MKLSWYLVAIFLSIHLCSVVSAQNNVNENGQPIHIDRPFTQDYSVKYYLPNEHMITLKKVASDRNKNIKVLSKAGLIQPHAGAFLYPGVLQADRTHLPMRDFDIQGLTSYQSQFIYLTDQAILSNAWAGSFLVYHSLPAAHLISMGPDFSCVISDGLTLNYLADGKEKYSKESSEKIIDIHYAGDLGLFVLLTESGVATYDHDKNQISNQITIEGAQALYCHEKNIYVGTSEGIKVFALPGGNMIDHYSRLPSTNILTIEVIDGNFWYGTDEGVFSTIDHSQFNFYNGERWVTSNRTLDIAAGPDKSVLILSENGLAQIHFKEITLEEKAAYFDQQVRARHIRHGFNATVGNMQKGNVESGTLKDSDNDGLWTAMYLAGQAFRYAVTEDQEALDNVQESLDGMDRLYSINPVPGFPSRSFERRGYKEVLSDPERWQHAEDPAWDWKATTSSDEAIGHIFAFGVIAEIIEDEKIKQQAITLIDTLMSHVVKNDLYLIDYDGKHTTWGRWHPDYVNGFEKMVGDRKLNSSNIIGMLQTAYHFTGKEKYREKAYELMDSHGYLENLMRPMKEIGVVGQDEDDWSKMLSQTWNHSDDEMYFVGYWGLYNYAFTDELRKKYAMSIIDHWEHERPEKEGLWNIMTALTQTKEFDLEHAIWYLQEHPLDLITWNITNSQRKDITLIEDNFRRQTTTEVLPPDERRIQRHNANMFTLDSRGGNGTQEYSAGDIWLLPYWMGRYLNVISAPEK